MTVPFPSISMWQAIRKALRCYKEKHDPTGNELRLVKSTYNRDGLFLEKLVAWGLLKVVEESAISPLESVYRITAAGAHAAEYGEWNADSETRKALPLPKSDTALPKAVTKGKK